MFYWTSEIAGKVKEILIINPQQCGPEPQIFADGERQGRAGVGKGACFAPGEGERGFWGAPDVFAKGAEPGGGRFGALIGVVSAGTSAGTRFGPEPGRPGRGGCEAERAEGKRSGMRAGNAARKVRSAEPRERNAKELPREGGEETPRVVRPCAARLDCGLRAFLSGIQPGSGTDGMQDC